MPQVGTRSPFALVRLALLAVFVTTACGGPDFLIALPGDPEEVLEILAEEGKVRDERPASVRATDRFLGALAANDGEEVWRMLDLRAAAAWQRHLTRHGREDAGPANIISYVGPLYPKGQPQSVERSNWDPAARIATVQARWPKRHQDLKLALSSTGWRVLVLPRGANLGEARRDPAPSDSAPPIERDPEIDEPSPGAPAGRPRRPMGTGGFGY